MKTVVITGANGFVGHYLAIRLIKEGFKVIATGKGPCRIMDLGNTHFIYAALDIKDPSDVLSLFERFKPEIVIHCAAMTKPDECELNKEAAWATNVSGTENILAAATATTKPFFIHLSTDFIFQGTDDLYKESDEGNPVNYYGLTKWEAEGRVKNYKGNWAIVRPILIYGNPLVGRSNILTFVADALREKKAVRLFTDQHRRPTYVEDLVWCLEEIIKKELTGIWHISGDETLTPYDIGMKVANYLQLDVSLVHPVTALDFVQPAKRPPKTLFDLTKTKQMLGYKPTPFDEGLVKTFALETLPHK